MRLIFTREEIDLREIVPPITGELTLTDDSGKKYTFSALAVSVDVTHPHGPVPSDGGMERLAQVAPSVFTIDT